MDTTSLVDAQIVKIKKLTSENEDIFAEKHQLVEELSRKNQLLFQKERDAEKFGDQEKELKALLVDAQLQQSQSILAEKNTRRILEIETGNCIERICGFGSVVGDEIVESALDAAGMGHSVDAIKNQSTMALIVLLSKVSKMSMQIIFIPVLWENHSNKLKWKHLQKWKSVSKSSSRSTHLYLFHNARSLRSLKMRSFASWRNTLRVSKRLFFMQKDRERKVAQAVFGSFFSICAITTRGRSTSLRLFYLINLRCIRHHFISWNVVAKRALLWYKQVLIKFGIKKRARLMLVSLTQWQSLSLHAKVAKKVCVSWKLKLKVLLCSNLSENLLHYQSHLSRNPFSPCGFVLAVIVAS
jgi:hypothetical protein